MKVAICAIAKNENLYIREWVEWYKNLGVSKIFLYDNNDPDGERFEEVIDDYIKSGFVEIIDVRDAPLSYIEVDQNDKAYRCSIQHKCYLECYKTKVSDFDWIGFFDIDEFVTFRNEYTLESFLNQEIFEDTDTVLIPWVEYDDNNLIYYDDRPVMERFTHLTSRHGWNLVKSFARTNKEIYDDSMRNMIHCFKLQGDRIKYANGRCIPFINNMSNWYMANDLVVNTSNCILNHYKTKTIEEFLRRRVNRVWTQDDFFSRPVLEKIDDAIKEFYMYCVRTDEKEEYIKQYRIKNEGNIDVDVYGRCNI